MARKKPEVIEATVTEKDCGFMEYDGRDEAYCHASEMGGPLDCPHADYKAKSYFPPCVKSWMKGLSEEENVKVYNDQFRGK